MPASSLRPAIPTTCSRVRDWLLCCRGRVLALTSGALAALGFAPFELWPLALLSCLGLLATLQCAATARQAALTGLIYGIGFFGAGVSWVYVSIHQFGNAPIPLALLLTALFVSALALLFALHGYLYKRYLADLPLGILLGFPALWVLAEGFRGWFLTGFPWLYLGYAPIDSWLAGWAPVTGVLGLSGFSALVASCLFLLPRSSTRRRTSLVLTALAPFASGALLLQIPWTEPTPESPLRVALVQANIPQALKWDARHRTRIIDQYLTLSRPLLSGTTRAQATGDTELLIWPETAIPLLFDIALPRLAPFANRLLDHQAGLISGVPYRTPPDPDPATATRYHNSIMGLGKASGLYHKQRLVPFGEYVPFESWLRGLIDFFNLPMSSFSLGPANQPPLLFQRASGETLRIAAYICYEIAYPDLVARNARASELLLTISNDSWFGDSLAPHQHLQMARMRALETGRYLIRSTNNGISALIDAKGNILQQGPQFTTAVLRGDIQPMQGLTPFILYRSWPLLALCALLLGVVILQRRRPSRLH
ncbi:MAG: apolipoprotein N-acyltransferase [Motiliproteus sp.]|jgi:apolipoprotein N-acyltransferase